MIDYPLVQQLADGRLQLRHGPIDLLVEAFGSEKEVQTAYHQAGDAFTNVLSDLVSELMLLRMESGLNATAIKGKVARDMVSAADAFAGNHFVTPMIAVAGAVADHVLDCMIDGRELSKAYVNNGGDTALYLTHGQSFSVGVCDNPVKGNIVSKALIKHCNKIRGIATSGWRGRSHSQGIADAVTVLATTAATADAAATLIANAVDLPDHPMIKRKIATALSPDSDLGTRQVTVDVGELTIDEAERALYSGQMLAQAMLDSGQIIGVYGCLNSSMFSLGLNDADHIYAERIRAGRCADDQINTVASNHSAEVGHFQQGVLSA